MSNASSTLAALETLEAKFEEVTGITSVVIRPDLGLVIGYASTSAYMLEARGVADGRVKFRVNLEWYDSAADIPNTYRKARAMAAQWENNADMFAPLLEAKWDSMLAYAEWREANA